MARASTSRDVLAGWATEPAGRLGLAVAIFVLAVALRLLYVLEASTGPFFASGGVDSVTYWQRAFEGLGERWPGAFAFNQPPLYPLWLAFWGGLVGESPLAIKAVQAVFGAFTCVFVFFIGLRAFRRTSIALLAGLFCAVNGTLIYFDGQIVSAGLETFLVCAALLALMKAADQDGTAWWLLAGFAMGLSAINRGAILFTLPWVIWWLFRYATWTGADAKPRIQKSGLQRALLVGLPLVACVLPVTLHNFHNDHSRSAPRLAAAQAQDEPARSAFERVLARDFVFITSRVAMNLYLGNDPAHYAKNDPNHPDCFTHANAVMKFPYRETRERSASGQQRVLFARTREAIREDPMAWLGLVGRKALDLINANEIPRNANLYAERQNSAVLRALLWPAPIAMPGALLIPLGLLGLVLDRRNWRQRFLLLAFLLPRAAFVVAFFVAARLRLPLMPILTLFAAFAIVQLADRVRASDWGALRGPVVAFASFLLIANLPLAEPHQDYGAYEHINHAKHLTVKGAHAVAVAHYRKAVELAPHSATSHFELGAALERARRADEAVPHLEQALRLDPGLAEAAISLARIHGRAGRAVAARLALDRALLADPRNDWLRRQRDRISAPPPAVAARPEAGRVQSLPANMPWSK